MMKDKKKAVEIGLVRHQILNNIRAVNVKFGKQYGQIVLCCDDHRNYWRRDVFPFYKSGRKAGRDQIGIDWVALHKAIDQIIEELRVNFPYIVLQIARAEADDIIGALCHQYGHLGIAPGGCEKILIISRDKDFIQLQKYANVEQYSVVDRKFLRTDNPERVLREHIICGDRGDSIPNFLSADNVFVTPGARQKKIYQETLNKWVYQTPEQICTTEEMQRGYDRNQMLINLDYIPGDIQQEINTAYSSYIVPPRSGLLNFFIKNQLRNLTDAIGEF